MDHKKPSSHEAEAPKLKPQKPKRTDAELATAKAEAEAQRDEVRQQVSGLQQELEALEARKLELVAQQVGSNGATLRVTVEPRETTTKPVQPFLRH